MADSTNIAHQSCDPSSSASTSTDVSPCTNSNSNYNFEVFINHHGEDTKKTLASQLYHRLCDRRFKVFLDRTEMREGNSIKPQLEGAIATASVNIAIFSPRYAQSEWCLTELKQMHDRLMQNPDQVSIIPIFYKVKPCDLRIRTNEEQHGLLGQILGFLECPLGQILRFLGCSAGKDGVYAEAFRRHVKKGRYRPQQITDWKNALSEVSKISGLELKTYDGDEGELVEKVIQLVEEKVRKLPLYVANCPTGLDEKLQDFQTTVMPPQPHSGEPQVVGIVGSAGVGKTTLATEFFNRNRSAYSRSCFLKGVRAKSLSDLLNKLIQHLISRDLRISNNVEDIKELSRRLLGCKALVILDDVDDARQLKAVFSPLKEALSSDSLIVLTSRNRDALSTNGVSLSSIYKLSGLTREHSQVLFCQHAFQNHQPAPGFEEVVTQFLDLCDGLPLFLEVLGAPLFQKDLEHWTAELRKRSALLVLPADIESSLKISYDCLDQQERQIFLDIACFFIEEDKDLAISVWDGSGWEGKLNLQNLEYKSILEIDCQNRIRMHNHVRDFGRKFAEEELPKCHRRLWRPNEDLSHYASIQPMVRGINRVQGISDQSFHAEHMRTLRLLRAEGDCLKSIAEILEQTDQLLWLCWNKCPEYTSLPSCHRIRNLRALQMTGGELRKWCHNALLLKLSPCADSDLHKQADYGGDSGEVQHINLNGCSRFELLTSCSLNLLELEHLEHLDLRETKIKEVSFREGFCPRLKHLNISCCTELMDVGALPTGLISLNLQRCTALKKVSGLPGLAKFRVLDISGCNELEELPGLDTLSSSLEVKGIYECSKLKESVRRSYESRK